MIRHTLSLFAFVLALGLSAGGIYSVWADPGHTQAAPSQQEMLEEMKKMHGEHRHEHDFEAMEEVSAADMGRMMSAMRDIGLALPPMNSHRGRELFIQKGCVICHSINDVGGAIGPSLNAADMPEPMNAFEFAARMWRGAPAMAQMQQDLLGEFISLSGQDLADLVAFAHDETEQRKLKTEQIPKPYRALIVQ